jgi:hypothetical protein
MMPITLPSPSSAERNRLLTVHVMRTQALDRLYERRAAVDNLIESLEDYMRCKQSRSAECVDFLSAARKCS